MKIYSPGGNEILDIIVDDTSVRYRSIMNDDSLTLNFSTTGPVTIPRGAYCDFEGARYTLFFPSNFKKHGSRNFQYTVVLHGHREALKLYKFKDLSSKPYRLKFPLAARPEDFLQLIVDNMNLHDAGWSAGDCIVADEKLISFNHEYCLGVLNRVAEEFSTEWEITGKTIHLRKVEKFKDDPLQLSYGMGNGFKTGVGRQNSGDKQPIGRLYVEGGERNIDFSTYGSLSLLLPKSATLIHDGKTYRTDADGMYITRDGNNNTAEDSYDGSNHYPRRVGTVSEVIIEDVESNFYDIIDSSIPESLDYGDCRIAGEKATIVFQTGALAGREFDIEQTDSELTGYIHAERRFKIVPAELDGQIMPGGVFVPSVGDKYAIFNISMPSSYIRDDATKTGASWDMFREAVKYFAEHENDRFIFTGELDGVWSKSKWLEIGAKIVPGGHVLFSDPQFQPGGVLIRITDVKDHVNMPQKPEITLSNAPVSGSFSSELGKLEAEEVYRAAEVKSILRLTKRQYVDAIETITMLASSFLDFSDSIDPITVRTMQLLVGDESLQFDFVTSMLNPRPVPHNVSFNPETKVLTAEAGLIQHLTLGIDSISVSHPASAYKFWNMSPYTSPPLIASKAYFLYARCSKSSSTGVFLLSETAIDMHADADQYHLLVGIVNKERDGGRSFAPLYGFTEILPGRITARVIASQDGRTYFDLLQGIIRGNITFISIDDDGEEVETDLDDWVAVAEQMIDAALLDAERANNATDALELYVDNAFRDGVIDAAEAKAIEKYINSINEIMSKAQASYQKVFLNQYLEGVAKTDLENAKINLWGQRDTLLSTINTAISGGITTPAQKTAVDTAFSNFNTDMQAFQNALEEANKAIQVKLDNISKGYVDDVVIGGRNLLRRYGEQKNKMVGGDGSIKTYSGSTLSIYPIEVTAGEKLIFSKTDSSKADNAWRYKFISTNGDLVIRKSSTANVVFEIVPANATELIVSYPDDSVVKLEKGNKATDWTPAPEDVQAEIDAAVVKATYWSVKASAPVIYKDAINAATAGSHTPVTVSGELRSGTTTTAGGFITVTPNGGAEAGTATASPVTIAPANGDGKTSYTVRLYDAAAKTTLLDTMTIPVVFKGASGVNAINVVLSNEADVLPASPEGVVSDYTGSGTIIRVFEGATELTYGTGNGQYQVTASGSGITVGSASTVGNTRVYGVASNMTSDNATITFTITGKTASGASFSLTKVQAFAKSRTGQKGDKGDKGVSISLVDVEFAKNTSPTTAPTTGWTTTAPALSGNEQLWTRTKTAYSSGNPTYSTPVNITPKKGDTGAVGQGVESVTEEYAISTSKTTQPAEGSADWSTTQPTWVQGQYIWSRVKVVYKNPTSTVYTGYAVSSEWEAINNIEIGGRNLVIKTGSLEGYYLDGYWVSSTGARTPKDFIKVVPGGTYTMSIPISEYVDNVVRMAMWDENKDFVVRVIYAGGNQSQPIRIHTITIPNSVHYVTPGYGRDIDIKLEKGNKPTDWSPAPEDVQAEIDENKQKIEAEKTRVDEIVSDNVADPSEKQYLLGKWQGVQAEYEKYNNQAIALGVSKTAFENAYYALTTLLAPLFADLTTSTTITGESIRTAFENYYNARATLITALTNKVNSNASAAQSAANKAQGDVDALDDSVDWLEDYVDHAFRDGVIEESEAKAIEKYLNIIRTEKLAADSSYTQVHNSTHLEGTAKTNLSTAKTALNTAYNNLVSAVNSAISDGKVDSTEKATVDNRFGLFNTAIATFQTRLEEANKAIQDTIKAAADAAQSAADDAQDTADTASLAATVAAQAAAQAQAQANLAAAKTEGFTQIGGQTFDSGLIFTSIMKLFDAGSGNETAGISGILGSLRNQPSFWSGGTYEEAILLANFLHHLTSGTPAGQFDYQTAYSNLAPVTILHNGAAKIGNFIVFENGTIVMIDPESGTERLMFSISDLDEISQLLTPVVSQGSSPIGAGSTSSSQVLSGSVNVTKAGASATFTGTNMFLSALGRRQDTGSSIMVAQLFLRRNGVRGSVITSRSIFFSEETNTPQTASIEIPEIAMHLSGTGLYTIELVVDTIGNVLNAYATTSSSTLSWKHTLQGVKRQQYGRDGMYFFYSDRHHYFSETRGFDGRAPADKWNAPGVLACGSVSSGGQTNKWGAKAGSSSVISGGYRITLVGMDHNNYAVQVTPHTATTFRIGTKTSTYFEIFGTGGCDYTVFGNNYVGT